MQDLKSLVVSYGSQGLSILKMSQRSLRTIFEKHQKTTVIITTISIGAISYLNSQQSAPKNEQVVKKVFFYCVKYLQKII